MTRSSRLALLTLFAALLTPFARSQDNYEIQVYGTDTVAPRTTMVEIHSNFTVDGSKTVQDGMLPTNHAEHETLELTQGITDWSEVGFYVFTSIQPGEGWQWVGDHIRPRVRALLNSVSDLNAGTDAGNHRLVRGWLLRLYEHSAWGRLAVGRRSHSPSRARS